MFDNMNRFEKLLPQYEVAGFDPNTALTRVIGMDKDGNQTESLYMKYAPAMAWFLTVYPNGCLNHTFNVLNDRKATVTASIFRNASDNRPAATATCTRYYDESENGRYYEQNAVTAAYRKALGYLGFGTPIDAHMVDGIPTEVNGSIPEMTDAGVPITPPAVPAGLFSQPVKQDEPQAKRRGRKKKAQETDAPVAAPVDPIIQDDDCTVTDAMNESWEDMLNSISNEDLDVESGEDKPVFVDIPEAKAESTAQDNGIQSALEDFTKATETAPKVEEPKEQKADAPKEMTLEEASQVLVPRGEMRGKTIEEAARLKGKEFIRWHYDKARMSAPDSPFTKAAEIYCEFYGC